MTTPDASAAGRALAASRPLRPQTCAVCGRDFQAIDRSPGQPRYCSNTCKQRAKYQRRRASQILTPRSTATPS